MQGLDQQVVVAVSVTANAKVSDPVDVTGFNHVAFELPTFTSYCITATANMYLQASSVLTYASASTGTFRRVVDTGVYSATSGLQDWEVPSSTGNKVVACRPATRFNFVKVEFSNTMTAAMSVNVIKHM
jgi:hypothetical protein